MSRLLMPRVLLSLLYLGAADALHYLEGATASTEEIFASGTYSYAPQQYILYGIEYDHSAGFSGGNLTYGNISGPVVLLKREEICDMRPNFKYEGKVVESPSWRLREKPEFRAWDNDY